MGTAAIRGTVAILGPGLLGGSIALSLRRFCPPSQLRIGAFNVDEVAEVRALELADMVSENPAAVVQGAELVVFCTPIDAMPELARRIASHVGGKTVLTDVGSVKRAIVSELTGIFGARYVGAHPMAGSEQRGLAAAKVDLFDGAACFLVPGESAANNARVTAFWNSLGCAVTEIAADAHDEIVARLSHLPHLVAAALLVGAEKFQPHSLRFSGPGLRDTTRLASGPPDLWRGILVQNRDKARRALREFRAELERVESLLEPGRENELRRYLHDAAKLREQLASKAGKID